MLQFSNIPEVDFSRGIDQNSSPSAIPVGFCEDIVNMDIKGKSLVKRRGYEKLAGDVPVTVSSIKVTTGTATITLPATINLDELPTSAPIHIEGRMYDGSSYLDISFRASDYTSLSTFDISSGSGTLNLDIAEDLGVSTYLTIIQSINYSTGEVIWLDEITVDPATELMDITYTSPDSFEVQFVTHACTETYSSDGFSGTPLSMDTEETITAATHGLSNLLIPMFWDMADANTYKSCLPDSFKIETNGNVKIKFEPDTAGKVFQLFLTACDNSLEGTAAPGETSTVAAIADAESRYLVAACYVEDPLTFELSLVIPSSITYDEANNRHLVTFLHDGLGSFTNYKIVYAYGSVAANRLRITGLTDTAGSSVSTAGIEVPATLTVTGLNNELLSSPPYVNYVDNYEEDDETLCAAGGNVFRTYDPSISETYDARARLSADLTIGPTFAHAAYGRTGGNLVSASVTDSGYLKVRSITHSSGTEFVVVISAPGYSLSGAISLAALIPANTSVLTIDGSMKSRFNGDFTIKAASTVDSDSFSVTIDVPSATSRDKDLESGAICAIYSDVLTFQTEALFLPEDIITLSTLADCEVISVDSMVNTKVYVKSAEVVTSLYLGQRLGASARRSTIITPTVTSLVAGDIVTINGTATRVSAVQDLISSSEITLREAVQINLSQYTIDCPLRWQVIPPADQFLGNKTVSETELLRSVAGKRSMYFSSGIKYDGEKIYASGLPKFQMHTAVNIEEGSGVAVDTVSASVSSISTGGVATMTNAEELGKLEVGDYVLLRDTTGGVTTCDARTIYIVKDIDTTAVTATFSPSLPAGVGGHTYTLDSFVTYRYYLRLALLDRNGNLAVSASLGSQDIRVRLTKSAKVHISGTVLPLAIDPIDYSNLVVEVFRRREDEELPKIGDYYRLATVSMQTQSGYFLFTDTVADVVVEGNSAKLDQVPDPNLGGIGSTRMRPPSANFLTAINNQLVAGSFTGEKKATVQVTGTIASYSDFQDDAFVVTTTAGATSFYVCPSSTAITGVTGVAATSFTVTIASTAGFTAGDVILITRNARSGLSYKPTFVGWWTVDTVGTGTLKVLWSGSPATASITAAETADLVLYHKAGSVPLAHNLAYAPISGSVEADDTIAAGLSLHLTQAINRTMVSQGIYAFGGKDQTDYVVTVTGASLVNILGPTVTGATIFYNGRLGGNTATASAEIYGSRIAFSVKGYPEVFDSLDVASGSTELPLIHDVNPDNGEEVTAALPFFGTSSFGSAQQSDVLLVFKKRGGFLISPQAKLSGQASVMQELSVLGGNGCESPLSPIASQLGVLFANTTGIYLITKDFQLVRIGQPLKGFIDKGMLSFTNIAGCNDVDKKRIMFTAGDVTFALHLPESVELPIGWTRYESIPAIMWAHRDGKSLFASAAGFVGSFSTTRFADAGEIIDTSVLFRSLDAGFATQKKTCPHISVLMSANYDHNTGEVTASTATDFAGLFETCDNAKLVGNTAVVYDGLSDLVRASLKMLQFSPATAKAGFFQLKLETSKLDADFAVSQVVYKMALMRSRADQQAAESVQD